MFVRSNFLRIVWIACAASGCSVVLPEHEASGWVKDEHSRIHAVRASPAGDAAAPPIPLVEREGLRMTGLETAAAVALAGAAVDIAAASLENAQAQFESESSATYADRLYGSDGALRHHRFVFQRRNGNEPALEAWLVLEDGGRDGMRLTFDKLVLRHAKAKVLDASWGRLWWTRVPLGVGFLMYDLPWVLGFHDYGDRALDLIVRVDLEANWTDDQGVANRKSVFGEPIDWRVENVSLEGEPAETKMLDADGAEGPQMGREIVVRQSVWIPPLPVSTIPPQNTQATPKRSASGAYTLKVTVIEADEVGDLLKAAARTAKEQRPAVVQYFGEEPKARKPAGTDPPRER